MNLFLVGQSSEPWSPERQSELSRALADTAADYRLLDLSTFRTVASGALYAASVTTSAEAAAPRNYLYDEGDSLVLHDGCPVNRTGGFPAHDSAALARNWSSLPANLDGQYVAVRVDRDDQTLEVLTDPLGIQQTYYCRQGGEWLISNSVRLLARATGLRTMDGEGVALFLGMGWVGGSRTLTEGISTLPGGQSWSWSPGRSYPLRRTYFDPAETAASAAPKRLDEFVERLAGDLGGMLVELGCHFGPLECPITGGRDSRTMLGLMMRNEVSGRYFTSGDPDSDDVQIGSALARHFSLPHETRDIAPARVAELWPTASWRHVLHTDGMVTLAHVKNASQPPDRLDRLKLQLYGAGGAIAKGHFTDERSLLTLPSATSAKRQLARHLLRKGKLLRPAVDATVREWLATTVDDLLDRGVEPGNVTDTFEITEYERRWAGSQFRQVRSRSEVFSPFCTRPFAAAAFAVPRELRYAQHIPHLLLRELSQDLRDMRFDKPWSPQSSLAIYLAHLPRWAGDRAASRLGTAFARVAGRAHRRDRGPGRDAFRRVPGVDKAGERKYLLESRRNDILEVCLGQPRSTLWEFVDRRAFETIMRDDEARGARARNHAQLLRITTAFYYAALQTTNVAAARPASEGIRLG